MVIMVGLSSINRQIHPLISMLIVSHPIAKLAGQLSYMINPLNILHQPCLNYIIYPSIVNIKYQRKDPHLGPPGKNVGSPPVNIKFWKIFKYFY